MKSRVSAWGANLLLVLISVAVCLGGFEVALRLFLPQKLYRFPAGLFRNDPDLVFSLNPGFQGTLANPEYTTHVRINSLGLRGPEVGPKSAARLRILGVGDSFVSAFNMDEDKTFLSVARSKLRPEFPGREVEMVNGGTPNYGTWHELRLFRRLAPEVRPDAAVLFVYVGNDLENNLDPDEAVVRDGFLLERRHTAGILPYPVRSWLQRNSMAYVFLWNAWNQFRPWFGKAETDPLRSDKELASPQAPPDVEKGYRLTADLMGQFRDEARSRNVPLLVVVIPTEFQVYPARFEKMVRGQGEDPSRYDLTLASKRWDAICRAAGLPVLDLLSLFRSHASGPYLYMSLDGHLTEEGNRLAGEATAEALESLLRNAATSGKPS